MRDVVDAWKANERKLGCYAFLFAAQAVALAAQLVASLLILLKTS
ncbi:MAG: hypothetical protein ABSC31_14430 [Acidimicrobiales bacterium]